MVIAIRSQSWLARFRSQLVAWLLEPVEPRQASLVVAALSWFATASL